MADLLVAQEPAVEPKEEEKPRKGWFFNPYTQILLSILLSSAAQLFLKKGADKSVTEIWLGVEGLRSGWVWLGILGMVSSLFCWLYSLRFVPLNIAYNLAGLIQVLVPVASWYFLGEKIGPTRACGIFLVCAGVYIVARPLMRMEEKL
jgi:undecaprenyl phosphate-alpha-L-ara4N flippase subunit ArnF